MQEMKALSQEQGKEERERIFFINTLKGLPLFWEERRITVIEEGSDRLTGETEKAYFVAVKDIPATLLKYQTVAYLLLTATYLLLTAAKLAAFADVLLNLALAYATFYLLEKTGQIKAFLFYIAAPLVLLGVNLLLGLPLAVALPIAAIVSLLGLTLLIMPTLWLAKLIKEKQARLFRLNRVQDKKSGLSRPVSGYWIVEVRSGDGER